MKAFAGMALVPNFISLAAKYGVSLDSLYARAELEIYTEQQNTVMPSVEDVDKILQAYRDIKGSDSFFLNLGLSFRLDSLGPVGSIVATSTSPREALFSVSEFKDIIHPFATFKLLDYGDNKTAVVLESKNTEPLSQKYYYTEIFFSAFVSLTAGLLKHKGPKIYSATFKHPKPIYEDKYREIFGDQVSFSRNKNELLINSEWLDLKLTAASPNFNRLSSQKALLELSKLPKQDNLIARVTHCIEDHIGHTVLSMQKVANKLNTTPRTLQRRLKNEGTTYAALRDKVLYKHARRYLVETNLDMATISANLSFSDPATFNNAFKRWSDMSPGAYRKSHRDL